MADALKTEENCEPLKRAQVDLDVILKKGLHDFISTNTMRSFKILNLPPEFLQKDESYKKSKSVVGSLRVSNNVVELLSGADVIVLAPYKRQRGKAVLVAVGKEI
ncbi:hypothetical protein AVEN_95256-1 [Araneus ventricosus]|uniref:Uncharacterized protein n=1 Tax=Araneus ventricosus TaxID=182803 RepID=A0A4Y2DFN3_ARAVE|nr:hypothetical protein AVEN_95256-1 [Araneus ventricosus]